MRAERRQAGAAREQKTGGPKGAGGEPSLLSPDDARTLFHEFGHALHGMLTEAYWPSQSGTSVSRDFVELPSQLYEHWLTVPAVLEKYARHYRTGEPMPKALLDKMLAATTFDAGFRTVEFTSSALVDMAFHSQKDPPVDPQKFEAETLKKLGVTPTRLIYKFDFKGARFIFLWSGKYDYSSPAGWDGDRPTYADQMKQMQQWLDEAKTAGIQKAFIIFHYPVFARSGFGAIPAPDNPHKLIAAYANDIE